MRYHEQNDSVAGFLAPGLTGAGNHIGPRVGMGRAFVRASFHSAFGGVLLNLISRSLPATASSSPCPDQG